MSHEQITVVPTPRMREIEQKFGVNGESVLDIFNRLHYQENQSFSAMKVTLGLPRATLFRWSKKLEFVPRTREEGLALIKRGPQEAKKNNITQTLGSNPRSTLLNLQLYFGFSISEIAHRCGKNWKTIAQWRQEFGLGEKNRKKRQSWARRYRKKLHLVKEARKTGILSILTPRQCAVLELRYPEQGLPLSYHDIGERLACKRQDGQQVETYAIRRLNQALQL